MRVSKRATLDGIILVTLVGSACKDSSAPPAPITVTAVSPANDLLGGGSSLTITGSNFIDVTSVTIGGTELGTPVVVSPTEIDGVVPPAVNVGSVDVVVSSSSHGRGVCSACFNYISLGRETRLLAASEYHTCALDAAGAAYCWGLNNDGALGNGSTMASETPSVVAGGLTFITLTAGGPRSTTLGVGEAHTCGLTSTGAAYCWGANDEGQLGDGSTNGPEFCSYFPPVGSGPLCSRTPVAVSGSVTFSMLSAGGYHTCGLTSSGTAYCWGLNSVGQLGNGSTTNSAMPVPVSGGLSFRALAAGVGNTCGLTNGGEAFCWGFPHISAPERVPTALRFASIVAGDTSFTCGLTSSGAAYCWSRVSSPEAVSGNVLFGVLAAGPVHMCGITLSQTAYCWGLNGNGQLGDGSTTDSSTPVAVSGSLRFSIVATAITHTCARTTAEAIYCWGNNDFGQLGTGSTMSSLVPVAVAGWPPP